MRSLLFLDQKLTDLRRRRLRHIDHAHNCTGNSWLGVSDSLGRPDFDFLATVSGESLRIVAECSVQRLGTPKLPRPLAIDEVPASTARKVVPTFSWLYTADHGLSIDQLLLTAWTEQLRRGCVRREGDVG
jgi:hypothetical protein